jgi:hypothetical protein
MAPQPPPSPAITTDWRGAYPSLPTGFHPRSQDGDSPVLTWSINGGDTVTFFSHLKENESATKTSTPYADNTGSIASSAASSNGGSYRTPTIWPPPPAQHHSTPPSVFAAAGAVTALIVCGLAMICCCLLCRKRKQSARRQDAVQMAERAGLGRGLGQFGPSAAAHVADPNDSTAYMHPPAEPVPAHLAPSSSSSSPSSTSPSTSVPSVPSLQSTQNPEQPVILSRTMDQSYYTGLGVDTSDHVSLAETPNPRHDSTAELYPDGSEEPPPPYRPASVPPISRDNSVRISNGLTLNRELRNSVRSAVVRSPFDDPEEDIEEESPTTPSPVEPTPPSSNTSTAATLSPLPRRPADAISDVSDLSYQQETHPHSNL